MHIAAQVKTEGQHDVTWLVTNRGNHRIVYGEHRSLHSCDVSAAHDFGECVRHAISCAGSLEPRERETA